MLSELEQAINARRRIYLLRHGEVSYFDENGEPYRQNEVPLNDEGRRQAEAAATALAGAAIDRVVVSGLPRTVQTAAALLEHRDVESETVEDLREISPGRMDDQPLEYRERLFTHSLREKITREKRFLGGETFGAHFDRVIPAFESLLAEDTWTEMAIVAHGGTNRAILSHALGVGLNVFAAFEQDAGCINIIDADPDGSFLVRLVNYSPVSAIKSEYRATTMERIWLSHLAPRLEQERHASVDE